MAVQLTDKMKAFLNEVFPAVIALKRPNGSIQVIPVWFEYRDGYFWLNSATARRWPQHLQKHGEVEMLLLDPTDMFRWLKCAAGSWRPPPRTRPNTSTASRCATRGIPSTRAASRASSG